jgi:hypothetical protein
LFSVRTIFAVQFKALFILKMNYTNDQSINQSLDEMAQKAQFS